MYSCMLYVSVFVRVVCFAFDHACVAVSVFFVSVSVLVVYFVCFLCYSV